MRPPSYLVYQDYNEEWYIIKETCDCKNCRKYREQNINRDIFNNYWDAWAKLCKLRQGLETLDVL